jgi:hypothetical protein
MPGKLSDGRHDDPLGNVRHRADHLPHLQAGLVLEPDKALLRLEYAKVLGMSGDRIGALREIEKVVAQGDEIMPKLQALALRNIGFQLVELARLDDAEAAFRDSLRIGPGNPIATDELKYIRHLRSGGELYATRSSGDVVERPKPWWQFWRD